MVGGAEEGSASTTPRSVKAQARDEENEEGWCVEMPRAASELD